MAYQARGNWRPSMTPSAPSDSPSPRPLASPTKKPPRSDELAPYSFEEGAPGFLFAEDAESYDRDVTAQAQYRDDADLRRALDLAALETWPSNPEARRSWVASAYRDATAPSRPRKATDARYDADLDG